MLAKELSSKELRKECDPRLMKCDTTEELSPLDEIIGQERAIRALRFGIDIKERGFNIFRGKHNQPQGRQTAKGNG